MRPRCRTAVGSCSRNASASARALVVEQAVHRLGGEPPLVRRQPPRRDRMLDGIGAAAAGTRCLGQPAHRPRVRFDAQRRLVVSDRPGEVAGAVGDRAAVVGAQPGRRRGGEAGVPLGADVRHRWLRRRMRRQRAGSQQREPLLLLAAERAVRERRAGVVAPRLAGRLAPSALERSPAGAGRQRRPRRSIGDVTGDRVQDVERFRCRSGASTAASASATAVVPGRCMAAAAVDGDRAERLGPRPLGPRRHRQVLVLRRGEPGLDLGVLLGAAVREPLLPAAAAGGGPPHEQLATAQQVRRDLGEPRPVAVDRGDPRALVRRDVEEEVGGEALVRWIRRVAVAVVGDGGDPQAVRVLGAEGAGGRREDTGVGPRRRPPCSSTSTSARRRR